MNTATQPLIALGQALAAMSLYGGAHPARIASRVRLLATISAAIGAAGSLRYSFLDDDVLIGAQVMYELRGWDWGARLTRAGIQRLEIDASPEPTDTALSTLLETLHQRLIPGAELSTAPFAVVGMRAGPISMAGESLRRRDGPPREDDMSMERLAEETDTVRWIHDQVSRIGHVPMAEVEAVVQGLAIAMQRDRQLVLPLLELRTSDQYTTAHACNVSMLSMALADELGLASADVRAIGSAALLHDIGKVQVPVELLVKPGALSPGEHALVQRHTIEGAIILSARGRGQALASIVAYEHHVWADGGGYPRLAYPRRCHFASRLVQVCNVYDSLSTDRPYRKALPPDVRLVTLQDRAGTQLDAEMVETFVAMAQRVEMRRTDLVDSPQADWTHDVTVALSGYADHLAVGNVA